MAQTTEALAQACAKIEISDDGGTTWEDISGVVQSVSGAQQSRASGEAYTFDGEGPIVKRGKIEPVELAFALVYTESATEGYELARAIFEEAGCAEIVAESRYPGELYVRWTPSGGTAIGIKQLTAHGPIVSFTYPEVDASSASPIMAGFVVKVGAIATSAIAA